MGMLLAWVALLAYHLAGAVRKDAECSPGELGELELLVGPVDEPGGLAVAETQEELADPVGELTELLDTVKGDSFDATCGKTYEQYAEGDRVYEGEFEQAAQQVFQLYGIQASDGFMSLMFHPLERQTLGTQFEKRQLEWIRAGRTWRGGVSRPVFCEFLRERVAKDLEAALSDVKGEVEAEKSWNTKRVFDTLAYAASKTASDDALRTVARNLDERYSGTYAQWRAVQHFWPRRSGALPVHIPRVKRAAREMKRLKEPPAKHLGLASRVQALPGVGASRVSAIFNPRVYRSHSD